MSGSAFSLLFLLGCSDVRQLTARYQRSSGSALGGTLIIAENAKFITFALLTSAMQMAWLRYVGGRLKSDFRFSIGLIYNNFPTSAIDAKQTKAIEDLATEIIEVRKRYPSSSLADMYDPDYTLPDLLKAHKKLDRAIDLTYRKKPLQSFSERIQYLFSMYEGLFG